MLIEEQNQKRRKWPLAVVIDAVRGADGRIRLLKLRTAYGKFLNRAVQKVYPLEISEEDEDTALRLRGKNDAAPAKADKPNNEQELGDPPDEPENVAEEQTAGAACGGEDVNTRQTRSGRVVRAPSRYR